MTAPLRRVPEALVVAKEYYLPPLEPLLAGILIRPERRDVRSHQVIAALRSLAPAPAQDRRKLAAGAVPVLMPRSNSMSHR
jgi:hypothetical protein